MIEVAEAVGTSATLMRASYFTRAELWPQNWSGREPAKPIPLREPTLEDVEGAVRQMRMFLTYVELLPGRRVQATRGRPGEGFMIVRISNEGQYRLDDALHARVNELDYAAVAAVDADDEEAFYSAFEELLQFVRSEGEELDERDETTSDVILPPADLSFVEAGEEFTGGERPMPVPYRLRAISTGSLDIAIDLAHWWVAAGPLGLIVLAEKVSTFKPRVSRKREEDLLAAAKARTERMRLEQGREKQHELDATATALAWLLRDVGPRRNAQERGPDRIDLVDDENDELVEWDFRSEES